MYNGMIGGVGEGLQSFAAAYQQALNYQLEKAKAASLTDYQQKMANVADVNAKGGLLTAWGPEAVDKYDPDPNTAAAQKANANVDQMMQGMKNTGPQAPPPPDDSEAQPGFMGPPRPPGMLPQPQPQPQIQGPSSPAPGGLSGSPGWLRRMQAEQGLASAKELNERKLKSAESGTNFQYGPDPKTGMPQVTGQGPLTGNAALERQKTEAQIAGEVSGSRSPNATIAGQYDDRPAVKSARGSQIAMNQMIDNYRNPSPQGDASLVLNAFKIKFPNQATDVNSIEELQKSQAVPDQWKQHMSQALSGALDQPTRDNLMRDGISTYRANVDSLRGEQQKFGKRAQANGVGDRSFLEEPAVDKTFNDAMGLQKKLGPYVPPAQRPNAGLLERASGWLNGGSPPAAAARAPTGAGKAPPPGMSFEQFKAWKASNGR